MWPGMISYMYLVESLEYEVRNGVRLVRRNTASSGLLHRTGSSETGSSDTFVGLASSGLGSSELVRRNWVRRSHVRRNWFVGTGFVEVMSVGTGSSEGKRILDVVVFFSRGA